MSLSDKIYSLKDIQEWIDDEDYNKEIKLKVLCHTPDLKQSIKELKDKRKLYSGTNEWVVNVNDIDEVFGKELTEGDNF